MSERYVFKMNKEDFLSLAKHDGHTMSMVFVSDTDLEIMCDCAELSIRVCEFPAEDLKKEEEKCPTCDGSGKVPYPWSYTDWDYDMPCPDCVGKNIWNAPSTPDEPEKGVWMGDNSIVEYEDDPGRCCMTDCFGYRCEKRTGHKGKHNVGNPKDPFYSPADDPEKEE